jgi:FAD/FMN-containing dehydrogenase/Fe-S oxidoreductase
MNADAGALVLADHPPAVRTALDQIRSRITGEVRDDRVSRLLFATDASMYEVVPWGVAMPRSAEDLRAIVDTCRAWHVPIVPRAAGTSLAGQTVGAGLIVDTGRYLTRILEVDEAHRTVIVEPGVIRDDLNRALKPRGLMFGPDTSTSNRAMIGGMVGNNSCGSYSIRFGTTRENVVWIDTVLADGTEVRLQSMNRDAWAEAMRRDDAFGRAVATLDRVVRAHAAGIRAAWPREDIVRRNTGYPLDDLANTWLGHNPDRDPDLARFFCGTEGTLGLMTKACLRLWPIAPHQAVVVSHFATLDESLQSTVAIVRHKPAAVELLDKRTLDLALLNVEQRRNREFLVGDPGALLVTEFQGDTADEVQAAVNACIAELEQHGWGYAHLRATDKQTNAIWELRKAGLGVLMGSPGDIKPVTLVEDTAVAVKDLPAFIRDFQRVMADHQTDCVYYAHASVGELHMRPEMNLKRREEIPVARSIAEKIADLVRQYQGALSGEHGDGRLRSPFLIRALGEEAVGWLGEVKRAFDPDSLFNPGNIVDPEPFENHWRFHEAYTDTEWKTEFQYEESLGFQRAVERCNGAGVCRRTTGGTMCPSYMVTHEERESTRGRANLFRHLIQQGPDALYRSEDLRDALDLCISCKGCKSDCPASVDMARLKAEFEQGWMDRNGVPLASRAFASVTELARPTQWVPGSAAFANWMQRSRWFKSAAKAMLHVSPRRTLPAFAARSFAALAGKRSFVAPDAAGTVLLYIDEFTDRYEPQVGKAAVDLLLTGGYSVEVPRLGPSGRTWLSKGFVRDARRRIEHNLRALEPWLDRVDAIVGIEPSAILTYIDESLDLFTDESLKALAKRVAEKVRLVDTFVVEAVQRGAWRGTWTDEKRRILVHGHCHQKALVGTDAMKQALALPKGYTVEMIPSGCCGMAGSFGYVDEHFETSMAIGELVLFPAVRKAAPETIVAAPGTSCRHQIHDGTGRQALHPIEVLQQAARPVALAAR